MTPADGPELICESCRAQITIASFADIAEPVLASARVMLGDNANPGREALTGALSNVLPNVTSLPAHDQFLLLAPLPAVS